MGAQRIPLVNGTVSDNSSAFPVADGQSVQTHSSMIRETWKIVQGLTVAREVEINGYDLGIAGIVAVARWVACIQPKSNS